VSKINPVVRIAALADLHYGKNSQGSLQSVFSRFGDLSADVLVLCGDLTDYGLPDEARALVRELAGLVKVPIVAVLGNHDYEADAAPEVTQILSGAGINVLDGDTCEIEGVGFAGTKGFAGGFGRGVLSPWGEPATKRFVREAVDETLKLETALSRLRTAWRIAVLHYAPIPGTVEGEPREIYPFLGCSRLEEPLARYSVTAVLHGHAHHGAPEGRTSTGIPVHNVALPLLKRVSAEQPFRVLELAASATSEEPG
jgi:Icc-related predicted phosphoesterase